MSCIDEIAATGGTGLAKLRKLIVGYAETMTTDYGKSLVRFDVRDLTEHNRKIVRLPRRRSTGLFVTISGRGSRTDRSGLATSSCRPLRLRAR